METTEQTAIFEQYLYRRYGDRSTPKHYLSDLRIFLAYLGAKPLQQVTVADIDAFIDAGHSQSLAATTINRRLATLHTFFECLAAQAPNEAWPNPLPKHLSAAEYERLTTTVFAATTQTTLPALAARAWFLTLAHTGMRLNELLDLRISDVDFANGRILICNPKRGRDRIAYLTPSLAQYLQTYLRQRPDVADDHVWFYDGKLLADEAVRDQLGRWGRQCGVKVTPQQLRHTFATQLINQGSPIESVRKLLGHQTLNMTLAGAAGVPPPPGVETRRL